MALKTITFISVSHARSVSLPSRNHPIAMSVEEHLNRIRSSEAATSSSASSASQKLEDLKDLWLLHRQFAQDASDPASALSSVLQNRCWRLVGWISLAVGYWRNCERRFLTNEGMQPAAWIIIQKKKRLKSGKQSWGIRSFWKKPQESDCQMLWELEKNGEARCEQRLCWRRCTYCTKTCSRNRSLSV